MYLSTLKLWNFRKYGSGSDELNLEKPDLDVQFQKGLNVLIGENDSGKTAIVDAIKLVLKTHAYEWIKVNDYDFYGKTNKLRIELYVEDFTDEEGGHFVEWLGFRGKGPSATPILRLIYQVERRDGRILPNEVLAGMDNEGKQLSAQAKEYLKVTFLRALRDADDELSAKRNSRISQILEGHSLFKQEGDSPHPLVESFNKANLDLQQWFSSSEKSDGGKSNKEQIQDVIDGFLEKFISESFKSQFQIADPEIKTILEKISIGIADHMNLGLGTMNRLYMAAELLHLRTSSGSLSLCLIEELEAHLHPQAQMKVIEALEEEKDVQYILTTHSPNLASKVNLSSLIICEGKDVFPLGPHFTKLDESDYTFLQHFLDVTKSNLFFAKGVILVEGWAEEILIPAIAKKIKCDLTKNEVSIVNVGSTAYLRYAKIFLRNDGKTFNKKVSILTDLDVRPNENGDFTSKDEEDKRNAILHKIDKGDAKNIQLGIAKHWTLEWCLFKSHILSDSFMKAASTVHPQIFQDATKDSTIDSEKFKVDLIKSLTNSSFDKVQVATLLSTMIDKEKINFEQKDDDINYLLDAIKFVCKE